MYVFKDNISIKEYEDFYKKYSRAPIMQDYAWAKVKSNFEQLICGLYKDNKLVAASLILIRKLPFNLKLMYASRGYLIDFTNKELLDVFTKNIKALAKKIKAYTVKVDPYVALSEKRVNPFENESYQFYSRDHELICQNLEEVGYIHQGLSKKIGAYLQPRFTMAVPLIDEKGKFLTEDLILKSLKKNVRNYLGDYQAKRGITFSYSNDINDIDEFIKIINSTEQRQKISLRNKNYYNKIMASFGKRALLFFGKIDIDKYLDFVEETSKEKDADQDFLEKQKEMAIALKKERGNIITASAALVILPANTEGIRMAEFLYAGNDTTVMPNLKINNGLTFYRLMYCLEHKYQYANLGGIDGSLSDHLSTFKSKFNPLVIEFIGEYNLPINKIIFRFLNILEPIAKKIYKVIIKLIK